MPNTLTIVFTSAPSTEPVEFPHPNTGVYVTGTQQANGTWQAVHTGVTKGTYGTLTGRLKNYPAVTATIAASGPVLNIQQTAPAGTSATASGANSISVTGNSSINAAAYRFFSATAQAGPYSLLVTQAAATYNHTGLAASTTLWYQMQYVGSGFYDDSPVSVAFSGATGATVPKVQVIAIGDSITYGAAASNTVTQSWVPLVGSTFPNTWVPIKRIGTPGEKADAFIGLHQSALIALFDATATVIYIPIAYGANDLNAMLPAQFITNYTQLHTAVRALDPRIKTISITVMNRVDSPTLTGNAADFDTRRTTANTSILANSGISDFVIDLTPQPLLAAATAVSNLDNFADGTHPTTRGHALYANVILPRLSTITSTTLGLVTVPAAGTSLAPLSYIALNRAAVLSNGIQSSDTRALDGTTAFDFLAWGQVNKQIVVANGSAGVHIPYDSARSGAALICFSASPFVDGDSFSKAYASVYLTSTGPSNVSVFQGATAVTAAVSRPTDISVLVQASGINFYQTDINAPFYTMTGAPPATLYVYTVLYHQNSTMLNATIEGQGIVVIPNGAVEESIVYSTLTAVAQNVSVSGTGATTKIFKLGGVDWADGAPATRALQAGGRFKLGQIAASGQGQSVRGTTRKTSVGTTLSPRYNELEYSWYIDDTTTNPAGASLANIPGAAAAVPPTAGMLLEILFSADGTRVDWLRNGTVVATLSPAGGVVFPQVPEVTFRLDNTAGVIGASIVGTNLINSGF